MPAGIHFNQSTLKSAYNNVTKKLIVSSSEFGLDCRCFLDPAILEWNINTKYKAGDYCFYDGKSYRAEVATQRVSPLANKDCNRVYKISFDTGISEPNVSHIFNIAGSSSEDAKFMILSVTVTSGTWSGGDAAGTILIYGMNNWTNWQTIHSVGNDFEDKNSTLICNTTSDITFQYRLTDTDYWTKISDEAPYPIDNGVWQTGGYGGFGRTPKYMTVSFNIQDTFRWWFGPDTYNKKHIHFPGTFRLKQTNECTWSCRTNPYSRHGYWVCTLTLGSFPSLYLHWSSCSYWESGEYYEKYDGLTEKIGDWVTHNGELFTCIKDHTSNAENEPGVGVNSDTYWNNRDDNDEWIWHQEYFNANPSIDFYSWSDDIVYYSGYYAYYSGDWYISNKDRPGEPPDGWSKLSGTPNIMLNGCQFNKPLQNAPSGMGTSNDIKIGEAGGTATISVGYGNLKHTTWGREVEYALSDVVLHNGVYYICVQAHTSHPNFIAWDSETTYAKGNFAWVGGICYTSKADDNTDHEPPNGTWWEVTVPQGGDEPGVGEDWKDYWDIQSGC